VVERPQRELTRATPSPTAAPAGDLDDDVEIPSIAAAPPALPTVGPEAVTFLDVLRRRDFRLLWVAQACSQLADKFLMYTLLIVVFTLTGRSSTQSLVLLAYTLPSILFSVPAGVFADRHDKRFLMIGTNIVRAGLLLLIPVILATPRLGSTALPLVVVTATFSAVGQVFAPAEAASIPFLVKRDQIMLATSLFMTTVVGTLVAGVPLAALTIKLRGSDAAFYMAATLLLIGAACILFMRTRLRAARHPHPRPPDLLAELREGIRMLAVHPVLKLGLLQLIVALVTVFTMFVLAPAYATHVLESSPEDNYQLLLPAVGGIVLAAVALGRRGARLQRAHAVWLAAVLAGALLMATGYIPGEIVRNHGGLFITPVVFVTSFGFGAAIGAILIVAFTVLQEATDETIRGRIFGGIFTVMNAAVAVPLLVAGQLADSIGVEAVCVLLGVALVGWGVLCRTALWGWMRLLDTAARAQPQPVR
jgi:MFS family permease